MKKNSLITICVLYCLSSYSQITTSKVNGGSVVTKLSMGISVNTGSTLTRDWIVLNDEKCPVQLKDVGVNSVYGSSEYRFVPSGSLVLSEQIVAYEIHHVLYDVFGSHIKSLNNMEITDLSGTVDLKKISGTWYATENEISEYFSCVSYVAAVRIATGVIWRFKPQLIKDELSKIQIAYEEGYSPSVETKGK